MGCTMFCTDAPELINMVAMAMKTGQTSTFLRDFIFTHPSMSEGLNQFLTYNVKGGTKTCRNTLITYYVFPLI